MLCKLNFRHYSGQYQRVDQGGWILIQRVLDDANHWILKAYTKRNRSCKHDKYDYCTYSTIEDILCEVLTSGREGDHVRYQLAYDSECRKPMLKSITQTSPRDNSQKMAVLMVNSQCELGSRITSMPPTDPDEPGKSLFDLGLKV